MELTPAPAMCTAPLPSAPPGRPGRSRHRAASGARAAAALAALAAVLLAPAAVAAPARAPRLVFRPEGKSFAEVLRGLRLEVEDDFEIREHLVPADGRKEDMEAALRQVQPRLVVLMDNRSIQLYRRCHASLPDSLVPASVSLMAISLEREIAGLRKATGISYEVPLVTSALGLRSLLGRPLPRVGIVHREYLRGFVAANAEYCRPEGIRLAALPLRNKEPDVRKALKAALERLLEQEKVDAVWVPNDNALLTPDLIKGVWLPLLRKHRKPVMVGVETLVNPALGFGTFAVLPDHTELGKQLAGKVLEIAEAGYTVADTTVNQPLSVLKVVNLPQARKLWGLERKHLGAVDKVVE